MKVIRQGPHWPWNFECRGCQSELEATEDDVEAGNDDDGWRFWVRCPVCEQATEVPLPQRNRKVVEAARARYDLRRKPQA